MKKRVIYLLAKILPDYCPTEWLLGLKLCKLNPLYEDVIQQKLKNLGYHDN